MINGMLDFGDDDGVSGFVGGGVGIARVDYNNVRAFSNQGALVDDSDTRFAWQVVAGVRQAITDNIDITLRYRFFNVDNVRTVDFRGLESELAVPVALAARRHHLQLRRSAAAPAAPAAVPGWLEPRCERRLRGPAAPAAAGHEELPERFGHPRDRGVPCSDHPGAVHRVLRLGQGRHHPGGRRRSSTTPPPPISRPVRRPVTLAGHADRSGSDAYNVGLSQRRANNVRSYLAGRGVPDGSITTEAFGESRPLVDTADGVREPQNRRVEITFGPGSGW